MLVFGEVVASNNVQELIISQIDVREATATVQRCADAQLACHIDFIVWTTTPAVVQCSMVHGYMYVVYIICNYIDIYIYIAILFVYMIIYDVMIIYIVMIYVSICMFLGSVLHHCNSHLPRRLIFNYCVTVTGAFKQTFGSRRAVHPQSIFICLLVAFLCISL